VTAEIPGEPVAVPAAVAALAGDDLVVPVWRSGPGRLTFRLEDGRGRVRYAKWIAGDPGRELSGEAERLRWAQRWTPVPHVLEHGSDREGAWLLTTAVPGRPAVDPRWVADPAVATTAIGRGLRMLHDALPVAECPFVPDADVPAEVRARIGEPPPPDRVVCHGDACVPNTLLHDDGTFAGHVDLGLLGVGDRWADLAEAAWSIGFNYGPGHEHLLYEGYGIDPDPRRIAYQRLLRDAAEQG
jgi:kanamycin kinase